MIFTGLSPIVFSFCALPTLTLSISLPIYPGLIELSSIRNTYIYNAKIVPSSTIFCRWNNFLPVQIKIPLSMVDLAQTVNEWKDVESNKEDEQYLGDICFSLRYVPNSGKVFLELKLFGHFDGNLEPFISLFSQNH